MASASQPPTAVGAGGGNIGLAQKKKVLKQQLLQAPPAIQQMRKTIIDNANFLIEEMRSHDFTEVSEILRVCTALGMKRAFLRGLQHDITEEGEINRYIYRFNMLGALPWQDKIEPTGSKNVALVLVEDSYMNTGSQSYAIIGGYQSSDNALQMIQQAFPAAGVTSASTVGSDPFSAITIGSQKITDNPDIVAPSFFNNFSGGVFSVSPMNAGYSGNINRDSIGTWIMNNASSYSYKQTSGTFASRINDIYVSSWNGIAGAGKQFWSTGAESTDLKGGGNFAKFAFNYYVDSPSRETQSILVQAINMEGEAYAVVNGTSVAFTASNKLELPLTSFIPKYRDGGNDPDLPWLPYMKCSLLRNIPDTENCVSSTDISTGALDRPDLNILIPYGTNQYPYNTPNNGFPYLKDIQPKPLRLRMVMDGSPVDGERVIIQNRFALTGFTEVSPGDPGTGTIRNPIGGPGKPTFTPGPGDDTGPGDTVIIDSNTTFTLVTDDEDDLLHIDVEYNPTKWEGEGEDDSGNTFTFTGNTASSYDLLARGTGLGDVVYSGSVMYQRDPVTGTNTRFEDELKVGNIIEIVFPTRYVGGTFYTMGGHTIYYSGTDFTKKYHNDIRVQIADMEYILTDQVVHPSEQQTLIDGYTITYDATYRIAGIRPLKFGMLDLLKERTDTVNLYPDTINNYISQIEFPNLDSGRFVSDFYEVGDLIQINGVKYRFQAIEGNRLKGVYRTDNVAINAGQQGVTLTRFEKFSRSSNVGISGALPEFKIYHKVSSVDSQTTIQITPDYNYGERFEGTVNRIGFNIESQEPSPAMYLNGFDIEGVGQFRLYNTTTNAYNEDSPTFYIPPAIEPNALANYPSRAILYHHNRNDFTKAPTGLSAKPVFNVKKGVEKFMEAYDYNLFQAFLQSKGKDLGQLIYEEHFEAIEEILNQKENGQVTFTDGTDPYIVLETLENDDSISNGYSPGDVLTIRKVKEEPHHSYDDPFGDCVSHFESPHLNEYDYSHCGLQVRVEEVIDSSRFKVLKNGSYGFSEANKFFHSYDVNPDLYLTATNGPIVEYWAKYFKHVFMDGSVNANSIIYSTVSDPRTMIFGGKGTSASYYEFNYLMNATEFTHEIGSSPVNISVNSNHIVDAASVTETDDGTFVLSLDKPLSSPPRLLDAYFLRNVEFEYIELD